MSRSNNIDLILYDGFEWYPNKDGYYIRATTIDGKRKCLLLHRTIYEDFYNIRIPKGYYIHHIDLDIKNNDISNLKILTDSEHTKLHHKIRITS